LSREDAAVLGLARSLGARGAGGVEVAFILGSGLGAFADRIERPVAIPFADLEGMPRSIVAGHAGRAMVGDLGGVRVFVQQGRVHLYEGWSTREVTRSVRALARIGCRAIVLTNSAGGLHREWTPPTLMRITDHINLQGATSLAACEARRGSLYDDALGEALDRGARDAGVALERGVYAGLLGPSYETPAEIRMLVWMGADAVGMSTVCEAQAARAAGMRVAGVSCITNQAAGIGPRPPSHAEVLDAGTAVAGDFARLLECAIPHLLSALGAKG
jgi:purine-nucleoside phosphorylase